MAVVMYPSSHRRCYDEKEYARTLTVLQSFSTLHTEIAPSQPHMAANAVADDRMGDNGLWGSIARLV